MLHRLARALIAAALALAVQPVFSQAPVRPPIGHFFENAEFTGALLSPNAKLVAVRDFQWISDKRLVFDTVDGKAGQGDMHRAPGVFAVNRDGDGWTVNAIEKRGAAEMLPWNHFLITQRHVEDSDHVYLKNPVYEGYGWHLPETRIDFWTRVEKSPDRHIGKP